MTDAERKLWFALRDRRFARFKFRRQAPIGPFIADFVCFNARLVIEVDGGQHADLCVINTGPVVRRESISRAAFLEQRRLVEFGRRDGSARESA